jgi:hypothetical protein
MERLGAPSEVVRANALREADRMSPEALRAELAGFQRLADLTGSRGCLTAVVGAAFVIPALLLLGIAGTCASWGAPVPYLLPWLGGAATLAVIPWALALANRDRRATTYRLVEMLTKCRNRGAAGALLSATELPLKEPPLPIRTALTRLLAEFREGDEGLLNADQRDLLYGYRSPSAPWDVEYRLAMLHAISLFGNHQALAKAASMRNRAAAETSKRPEMVRVVEAALAAEKAIAARIAAREGSSQLLRPVASTADESALLRPAGSMTGSGDSLLRPAVDEAPADQAVHREDRS